MKRLRSFKVVAGGSLMLAILVAAEVSQAVAEGFLVAEENRMTALVNEHRAAAHGAPAMWQDPALQMVARRQAQRMSAAGFIYHNPNLGAEAGGAVPNWIRVGENVGVGPSVVSVQDAFLASPAHHANIDKSYNLVGLGAVASSNGALYFTQNFAQNGGVAPPPPPPPPAAAAQRGPGAPAPAVRTRCSRRGRRTICRQVRSSRARRAPRRRSSRVRGIELVQPTPDAPGENQSRVSFTRTVFGTLGKAADKVTFWD
ncbi:MAG TPA: CAP domain-containing protein [Acidimicrobiales bacterium]|nr:CAP domain-containing protein [Acidimicrobiales bacterium]